MAWTATTRSDYNRPHCRYTSDLTDEEWALIEGFISLPNQQGRPRKTNLCQVVDAILYMATTGCQWRMLGVVKLGNYC